MLLPSWRQNARTLHKSPVTTGWVCVARGLQGARYKAKGEALTVTSTVSEDGCTHLVSVSKGGWGVTDAEMERVLSDFRLEGALEDFPRFPLVLRIPRMLRLPALTS